MASRDYTHDYTSGSNLYLIFTRDSDGKVFDWSDNTWKVDASATTPGVAMSVLRGAGTGMSHYSATINLATINNTATPVDTHVMVFARAGGSVSLTADSLVGESFPVRITSGESVSYLGTDVATSLGQEKFCVVTMNYSGLGGTSAHCTARLETRDGEVVDLDVFDSSAECTLTIDRDSTTTGGERSPVESLTALEVGGYNADFRFEVELEDQTFDALVGYTLKMVITANGQDYEGRLDFGG